MKKIILFLIFTIFTTSPALAQAPTPRVEAKYTSSTTIVGTGENPGGPTIKNFTGGYAYISCSKTEPVECPKPKPGDHITIYAIVHIDDAKFPATIDRSKALVTLGTYLSVFFNVDEANVSPTPYQKGFLGLGLNYTWDLNTIINKGETLSTDSNTHIITMPVTALPTAKDNTTISLYLKGFEGIGGGGGGGDAYAGMDHAPTNDTCSNRYSKLSDVSNDVKRVPPFNSSSILITNRNYGDPLCTFKESDFKQVIKDNLSKYGQSPNNTDLINFWADMQRCEGTPNSHDSCSTNDARANKCSALGTWGMFQMSALASPGKKWTEEGPRGDVTWQRQVQNAIWYNHKVIGDSFTYWESAYCLCSASRYKDRPFCSTIKRLKLDKICSQCR